MTGKLTKIGAFEAKTRLSELLRETESGRSFVIHRRGRPVARLVPPADGQRRVDLHEVLQEFRKIRRRVGGPVRVRRLIEQGRRF
ncbi:MAG: type II toxin-antitoxin system prevent-host-death family antitoxin [Candidatus Rokuibacteriota bacterium]|nr:MAG: type II toxin-antitoxin system prevent-host-death family antitoxin [Candidatus Rokubacteria bacterium]